jgi:hypothetical protein
MSYSVERVIEVWDDQHGEHIDVGPDRDIGELVEIRSYTVDGVIGQRIAMAKEQAVLVAQAILELYGPKP